MKKVIFLLLLIFCFYEASSQLKVGEARTWDRYPPEVQLRGFGLNKFQLVQMDDDPQLEEVLLFSSDNGHYPYFDLFKVYYVIVDYYTKKVKYQSDIVISTRRDLILEDRNNDGKFELYRSYFRDGKFTTDVNGNNLSVTWVYDYISY